jgi:hypothetical protein
MTAPLTTRTDPAAINFCQAMRRRAIAKLDARNSTVVMKGGRPVCVTAEGAAAREATIGETTDQGRLTCTATFGPVTTGGEQTYHTRFALEGRPVSVLDAERIVMGLAPEDAA